MVKSAPSFGMHIDGSGWMATISSTTPLGLVGWKLLLRQLASDKATFRGIIDSIGLKCGFGRATFMWSILHKVVLSTNGGPHRPGFYS